jgi:GntR family transcriptional regulator/MocR family aminotransferase
VSRTPRGFALAQLAGLARGTPLLSAALYERICAAIACGALAAGTRLPSSRALARDLGLSRSTVELAFARLDGEGWIELRAGSGSYALAPDALRAPAGPSAVARAPAADRTVLSRWGTRLAAAPPDDDQRAPRVLTPCAVDVDHLPHRAWARAAARARAPLTHGDPAGHEPLRRAIAAHLAGARGVSCDWQRVIVVHGTQQALDLAVRLLLDEGDAVWLEEPGYLHARAAFHAAGLRIAAVPVDAEGLQVDAGRVLAPDARLAYVTPSHQYPLGVTMSLARRTALLDWAERAGGWIFEDDYDSELRYADRPIAAVQGLRGGDRVLYAGTFNKSLFPTLRVAYVVVPDMLVDAFTAGRAALDGAVNATTQATLAELIVSGDFAAHLRAARARCAERRDALVDALRRALGGAPPLVGADAGMHLVVRLPDGADDVALVRAARERGLDPGALSPHYLGAAQPGLLLGYSGAAPAELRRAVAALARVVTARGRRGIPAA